MTDLMPQTEPTGFYGPYRGIVTNTTDPANQNRIKAVVPQLFGNTTTETDWALPCQAPGLQSVPTPGQGVWIMFEGGDLNYPVFMGMWQPEPSVAPYEVAGAGASAVAQAVATSVAASESFTAAYSAMTLIAKNVLSAPLPSVTFSSIPQTFNHLRLVVVGRSDQSSAQSIAIQFNGDTGATNYVDGWIIMNAGAANGGNPAATSSLLLTNMPGTNATAGEAGYAVADIPLYAGTTFRKGIVDTSTATDATVAQAGCFTGRWLSTAAINSIKILTGAGNYVTGSAFYLYGVL